MKRKKAITNFPESVTVALNDNATYEEKLAEWKKQRNKRKRDKK